MNLTPSVDRTPSGVVRCTLAQPEQTMTKEELSYFKLAQKLRTKAAR